MGHQLLVVDDDPGIQTMLRTALEYEHFDVVVANNGQKALACLEQTQPDLILLDLMMPEMDGCAFVKELEQRGLRASIPVLVLTADMYATSLLQTMQVEGWLIKPFRLTELIRQIRILLAK